VRALLILLSIVGSLTGAEVETTQTDVAVYEVVRLPFTGVPFELSDSRENGVRAVVRPGSATVFASFSLENPATAAARLQVDRPGDWAVVGEQLYVAQSGTLQIYSLPGLVRQSEVSLGGEMPAERREWLSQIGFPFAAGPEIRVPGGWYFDGTVYDDTGTRIRALLYVRHGVAQERRSVTTINAGYRQIPNHEDRNAARQSFELETVPAVVEVRVIDQQLRLQVRGVSPGTEQDVHDELTLGPPPRTRNGHLMSFIRVDGADATFSMSDASFHLRVAEFDTKSADIPSPQRFQFDQPAFALAEYPDEPSYKFADGPETNAVRVTSVGPDLDREPAINVIESAAAALLPALGGRPRSLDAFRTALAAYTASIESEFVRTTGRRPDGIPVPVEVSVSLTWPNERLNRWQFRHVLWAEVTEEDLTTHLYPAELEAERRAEVQRQEQAREHQVFVRSINVSFIAAAMLVAVGIIVGLLRRRRSAEAMFS